MAETRQQKSERLLGSVHPTLAGKVRKVLKELEAAGWQPVVAEAYRTAAEQAQKLRDGYSQVAFSFHNATRNGQPCALAVDIVDARYDWNIPQNHHFWSALGARGKAHGCVWGGDWKMRDVAHLQLLGNDQLARVRSGYSPPIEDEEEEMTRTKVVVNGVAHDGWLDEEAGVNFLPFTYVKEFITKHGGSFDWQPDAKPSPTLKITLPK